jgi:hypothetical protein
MSRRRQRQDEAVSKRAQQILAERAQRRKRRTGGEEALTQAPEQPKPKRASRPKAERKERKPRVHADLLTVAFRGPLAEKMRGMAESYRMTLAKLVQDAVVAYEANVAAGYQPGTALAQWTAQQTQEAGGA